jgi:hypothetical protein
MTNEEGKGKGTVVFDLRLVHKGGAVQLPLKSKSNTYLRERPRSEIVLSASATLRSM